MKTPLEQMLDVLCNSYNVVTLQSREVGIVDFLQKMEGKTYRVHNLYFTPAEIRTISLDNSGWTVHLLRG